MSSVFPVSVSVRRLKVLKVALLLCGGALVGVAPAWAAPAPSVAPAPSPQYRLGVGDTLQITVSNHPDVGGELTVRPDGKVTLPGAGEVMAQGKTSSVLAKEIERRLGRTLNNARVQIMVKATAPRQASILGAVAAPSPYPIKAGWRVLDLIAVAGGLNAKPARIKGRLMRAGKVIDFDLADAVANPGGKSNLALSPEDTILLDAADFARQLTVTGDVVKPGVFDLEENLSVTSLLAQAGGATEGASLQSAYVLREGKRIPLDLSAMPGSALDANSPLSQFRFAPGDVLFVPRNLARVGVMGEVLKPSYYSLPEDAAQTTVSRVLSLSGGATPDGDLTNVTLTRANSTNMTIDVSAIIEGLAPDNVRLNPDDVLFVPKKKLREVSVIGPVPKPGSFALTEDLTLISLMAQAGSPTDGAGLRNAYVLRQGKQIAVDLRAMLVEGQNNPQLASFRMEAGDVVVIPDVTDQVTVSGQVAKPGAYNLSDDLSVVSLLAKAGNALPEASLREAYVIRRGIQIPLDLNVFLSGAKDKPWLTNFKLAPGDTLYIPENKVFYAVLGQVSRPGKFPYPDTASDATVLRALSEAGGPTGTGNAGANLKQAGIIRQVGGQAQVIPVDLDDLFGKNAKGSNNNIVLLPNDVLYIPPKKAGFNWTTAIGSALALGQLAR